MAIDGVGGPGGPFGPKKPGGKGRLQKTNKTEKTVKADRVEISKAGKQSQVEIRNAAQKIKGLIKDIEKLDRANTSIISDFKKTAALIRNSISDSGKIEEIMGRKRSDRTEKINQLKKDIKGGNYDFDDIDKLRITGEKALIDKVFDRK